MFHMQRWHIYIQAFCYSRKAKTSFQVALNEQTDQQESNPPVCLNPSALCQYDKTMQSFNQLGETYKQQQCALTWVLGGGKFVFRGREGRGNSQAPTTNQQRWGLAAGSVLWNSLLSVPVQGVSFYITSWRHKLPDMVTKHFLFIVLREEENCHGKKDQNRPPKVENSPVLPEAARLEVLQKLIRFWNTIFSTKFNFLLACQA